MNTRYAIFHPPGSRTLRVGIVLACALAAVSLCIAGA
jgi:hypothetical protein